MKHLHTQYNITLVCVDKMTRVRVTYNVHLKTALSRFVV